MNLKNKRIILVIVLGIIIATGTTLGITLPLIRNNQSDSQLILFTSNENIALINSLIFRELTNKSNSISTYELLNEYCINTFEFLKIISEIDSSTFFSYDQLTDSEILLSNEGFQFKLNDLLIKNIHGLAIDFQFFTADIAPTIYNYHSFVNWNSEGLAIEFENSTNINKTVIILLDGFGWTFWENLSSLGFINFTIEPFFIQPSLTVYPSITNVATATILSGFWPESTGIQVRQDHQLQVASIFDIANDNNFTTEYIEGNVGFLNLDADYEYWLTDQNANGNIDDEIYLKTLESLENNRSDLLFVHFHKIDDIGHLYGPNSNEWLAKVIETFEMVNVILSIVNNNTMVIITADHGMHKNEAYEDYRLGIHGESCYEDIVVPLIFIRK